MSKRKLKYLVKKNKSRPNTFKRYFHICWFANPEEYIKSKDTCVRRFWLQMVLTRGKARDVKELKDEEIKKFLPEIKLPKEIKTLWERYYQTSK